jgi:DNA-binding transcriptional ArsR family regulator
MPKDGDDTPQRPVDLRRKRRQPPVQIVANPAYDLLLSLFLAFGSNGTLYYELEPSWAEVARTTCPPTLNDTLAFFFGSEEDKQWCASQLCGVLWQSPTPLDIPGTLTWLEQIPVEQVLTVLLEQDGLGDDWYEIAVSLIQAQVANQGRPNEQLARNIQTFAKRFPANQRDAVKRFLTVPEEERARLVAAVRQWYTLVFRREEARIVTAITREATALTKRCEAGDTAEEIFTSTIRGIEFDLPAATERLILAPCVLTMPSVFQFTQHDVETYCFPIPDAARGQNDGIASQRREMVRLFDALADDTRLRILRHLAERTMYLTELSEHLKLTKATTRHHMVRLRAAGLVTLHVRDRLNYYTLRRETLDEPTHLLLHYLGLS